MRFLKIVLGLVGVLVLLIAGLFVVARFHDGPLGLVPGGALAAGEVVVAPIGDWRFVADIDTIETELMLADLDSLEKRVDALEKKAKGETPRVGPERFPDVPYPEPMLVPPPGEGGDGNSVNTPRRTPAKKEAVA